MSTGDTILVNQHNPPFQDIEQSLSSSLDRDGKGGMRADLVMSGNKITGLAPGVNPSDAATVSQLGGSSAIPIGSVLDYWGATPPEGYLFAAGQEISRSTYAALFAVIGTTAGLGNGSTTFNLPDYRGRIGAGRENMATPATTRLNTLSSSSLGATGGAQTHTLTEAQMPAHDHELSGSTSTSGAHTHTAQGGGGVLVGGFGEVFVAEGTQQTTSSSGSHSHTLTGEVGETGGGQAHNNVQPTIICNKIMKVA